MTDSRFVQLETKLAYLEETVHVLNQVVTRQQKQIDQLEQTCRELRERLKSTGEALPANTPAEEAPPHY